jgi:hypothetical protein
MTQGLTALLAFGAAFGLRGRAMQLPHRAQLAEAVWALRR